MKRPSADSEILVWQGTTLEMHPDKQLEKVVKEAYEADAIAAAAEYGAQFRTDIETFITLELLNSAIIPARQELPPMPRMSYVAFIDPSGGAHDSFALSIFHRDDENKFIQDLLRERRPPFSPAQVVAEFAAILRSYDIAQVAGDRYGGQFPVELFAKEGIKYEPSELPKSAIYLEVLPLFTSGKVELLDVPRLTNQLLGLERRTHSGGKDTVDHPAFSGARDDLANVCCGALWLASKNFVWELTDADRRRMAKGPKRIFGPERGGRTISAKNLRGYMR